LRDDNTAFLHILVAWSRFDEGKVEPATSQLYELVKLFPGVQESKTKEELLAKAQATSRGSAMDTISRITSGLEAPRPTGGVRGRRGISRSNLGDETPARRGTKMK
jgi:hypothetical protein